MTRAQAERRARSLRLMAGRLLHQCASGETKDVAAGYEGEIRAAHDALCRAFSILERAYDL